MHQGDGLYCFSFFPIAPIPITPFLIRVVSPWVLVARFAPAELPNSTAQAPDLAIRREQTGADRVQQLNNTLQGDHQMTIVVE